MISKTKLKSYIFRVEIEQEEGRWSAEIPLLPGCATWGYTREEALQVLRDATQAYIEVLIEDGKSIPSKPKEEVEVMAVLR